MSIWETQGKDEYFEHYRTSEHSKDLRKWVDDAYSKLGQFLDKDWVDNLRNADFYGRLWELEIAEWLMLTGLNMIPTNGVGFDFCVELSDDSKVWIEAVYSYPDEELREIQKEALASNGAVRNTPREQVALRFSSSLFHKANKVKDKYLKYIAEKDLTLIAVSSFGPDAGMWKTRDIFQLAILPINNQLVHFSRDGKPLDPNTPLPSHEVKNQMKKATGALVRKEFLYPGTEFPHIDAVMFSEASNLQQLLGVFSSSFNEDTNKPHIYQNYSGKRIPEEFTQYFFYHEWSDNPPMASMDMVEPKIKVGST